MNTVSYRYNGKIIVCNFCELKNILKNVYNIKYVFNRQIGVKQKEIYILNN